VRLVVRLLGLLFRIRILRLPLVGIQQQGAALIRNKGQFSDVLQLDLGHEDAVLCAGKEMVG